MIVKHELKQNAKSLLIWAITVGLSSALCILLYESVADSIKEVANLYQKMGGVSKALGMDKVSIATLGGYYAAEIALIYSLGAGMFAALLGVTMVSKEEEGHTAEFLLTLPKTRFTILNQKFLSMIILLIVFNLIGIGLEAAALYKVDMSFNYTAYAQYHGLCFLLQLEFASICFMISAFTQKKQVGLGMGIVLLAYFMDIICRLVDKIKDLKFVTPFYYANATDRFAKESLDWKLLLIATVVIIVSYFIALLVYGKRDIAS